VEAINKAASGRWSAGHGKDVSQSLNSSSSQPLYMVGPATHNIDYSCNLGPHMLIIPFHSHTAAHPVLPSMLAAPRPPPFRHHPSPAGGRWLQTAARSTAPRGPPQSRQRRPWTCRLGGAGRQADSRGSRDKSSVRYHVRCRMQGSEEGGICVMVMKTTGCGCMTPTIKQTFPG
jgi:hypothetical protein